MKRRKGGRTMEDKFVGAFSMLDVETVEAADFASAWEIKNMDKIKTRKYGKKRFSEERSRIFEWVGINRDKIRSLTFEQQEELMIKEGVITPDNV